MDAAPEQVPLFVKGVRVAPFYEGYETSIKIYHPAKLRMNFIFPDHLFAQGFGIVQRNYLRIKQNICAEQRGAKNQADRKNGIAIL